MEYCSAVWCSAADTHLKLQDRSVICARFLTRGVFECDIAHRRSVAVLCIIIIIIIQKIKCFILFGVTRCTLLMVLYVDHMCQCGYTRCYGRTSVSTYAPPRCEPRSTARLLFPSRCPSGTILLNQYLMVRDWRVSRVGPMLFYWPKLLYPYYSLQLFFPFSSFCL